MCKVVGAVFSNSLSKAAARPDRNFSRFSDTPALDKTFPAMYKHRGLSVFGLASVKIKVALIYVDGRIYVS